MGRIRSIVLSRAATPPAVKTGRQQGRVGNTHIPALGRLSWEESKASLGYIMRLSQRGEEEEKKHTGSPGLMAAT